ncbi:recombinase family protein, partial [Paracoccus sp. TK19116]|nr:recombinase family protein [Paracoccus albicereus]
MAGVPAEQARDEMMAPDGRRREIEAALSIARAADPVLFHPSMAATHLARGALASGLTEPGGMEETKEALRGLIEKIVPAPDP